MHEDNRRLCARVFSCMNPMAIQMYNFVVVAHDITRKVCDRSHAPSSGRSVDVLVTCQSPLDRAVHPWDAQ